MWDNNKSPGNITRKEWNDLLDSYLETGHMSVDDYEKMCETCKLVINEIKKSRKRTNKPERDVTHHSLQNNEN
jgi:hypothetical protein